MGVSVCIVKNFSTAFDIFHTIRDFNACKTFTIAKYSPTNIGNTVWNHKICNFISVQIQILRIVKRS